MGNSMISRRLGIGDREILLFLHTEQPPSREEWDAVMADLRQYAERSDVRRIVTLVVSDGGGPDVSMRAELMEYFKLHHLNMKTSVLTTSRFTRGIVSAVSWFNPQIKAFAPNRLPDAVNHIGLAPAAKPRLLRELADMERELAPNDCLAQINADPAGAST